jgi:hypothetical protein
MDRGTPIQIYWPEVISKIREFQTIAVAEDPELFDLWQAVEKVATDQFIETSTEEGLSRYEKMIGAYPTLGDTLESRRLKVLSRWNNEIPYTWGSLQEKVALICGQDGFEMSLQNEDYKIILTTFLATYGALDELKVTTDRSVPANIVIEINNVLLEKQEAQIFQGSAISTGIRYVLT